MSDLLLASTIFAFMVWGAAIGIGVGVGARAFRSWARAQFSISGNVSDYELGRRYGYATGLRDAYRQVLDDDVRAIVHDDGLADLQRQAGASVDSLPALDWEERDPSDLPDARDTNG